MKALPLLVCTAADGDGDDGKSREGVGRGNTPVRGLAGGGASAAEALAGWAKALRKRSRAFCS